MMDGMFIAQSRLLVLGSLFFSLFLFSIITICYLAAAGSFVPDSYWLYQISMKCPVAKQFTDLAFHDASYVELGLFFYLLGCYIGIVIDSKDYKGTHRLSN